MERAEGFTATLGLVKPGTVDRITQDMWRMTPADVNLTLYGTNWSLKMLHSGQFDAAAFDTQRDAILEAVREMLLYHDLDFIAVSGDLIQSAMGPVWDRALRESIQQEAGIPATTAMTSLADALEHVDARNVAVGTPFRDEQNNYVRSYLEQAGFSVTAVEGYPTHNSKEIRTLPANAAHESGRKAFLAAPGADAIYLSCPIWPTTAAVAPLEQEFGVPVLTMFNPILWQGLTAIGYRQPIHGFGRLLETVG